MTESEFNSLYRNKDFIKQFKSICQSFLRGNREALRALAIFDIEDLQQECLIMIWREESGKDLSYYVKAVQNRLKRLVGKGGNRNDIVQIEPLDDNLAYGIYNEVSEG